MEFITQTKIEKLAKAKKGQLLTTAELATMLNRSNAWIAGEMKAGRITPDARLKSSVRGRPSFLFKKGKFVTLARKNQVQADRIAAAKAAKAERVAKKAAVETATVIALPVAAPVVEADQTQIAA